MTLRTPSRLLVGQEPRWLLLALGLWAGCGAEDLATGSGNRPVVAAQAVVDSAESGSVSDEVGEPVVDENVRIERLIVGLNVPFTPEGDLPDSDAIAAQREGIARAQLALRAHYASGVFEVHTRFKTIPFVAVSTDQTGRERLENDRAVLSVSPDHLWRPTLAESVPLIGGEDAWAQGTTGEGAVVAILDSGVDKDHEFLSGKVIAEGCYSSNIPAEFIQTVCPGGGQASTAEGSGVNCPSSIDGCTHGTHVAGIAAGRGVASSGVARDADIVAIQVFSKFTSFACYPYRSCLRAVESDIIQGLEQVLLLRQGGMNIAAANMSLGGLRYSAPCDGVVPATKAAVDNLRSVNVVTVIAAGNDGSASSISEPGCVSSAVSVGATTKADAVDTSYSNSASFLTFLAPGSRIRSAIPGDRYDVYDGTSMAAPHVAGAMALLRSALPTLTATEMITLLQTTGVAIQDPRNGISKPRIQVDLAVAELGVFGVHPPLFDPPGGSYVDEQVISLTTTTEDAEIRYTLDGSTPTPEHGDVLLPGTSIDVLTNQAIAAIAYLPNGQISPVRRAAYTLHGAPPTFSTADGEYGTSPTVTILAPTPNTALRYTTDGSTPSSSHGTVATSGETVAITNSRTLRAVTTHPNWDDSSVASARYVLTGGLTVHLDPVRAADSGARWRRMDEALDGFEDGDLRRFQYVTTGDADWSVVPSEARFGTYALRSPELLDDESASISVQIACDGGPLTFSRKVSSEVVYDVLRFAVDGVTKGEWSGEVPWSTVSIGVPPGDHTFTWTYVKDYTDGGGDDAAWVDQIVFPGDQWRSSGTTVRVFSGSQRVAFSALPAWITPSILTTATAIGDLTVVRATYTPREVATPVFFPPAGTFTRAQDVTLSTTTPGAVIRYTTDGSVPTSASPQVTGPVSLAPATVTRLRAIAQATDWQDSPEASGEWTITGTVDTPTLDPAPGSFDHAVTVTLSTATPNATIQYTTDGSAPGASSPVYAAPIAVAQGPATKIRTRAVLAGWTASAEGSGTYTVVAPVAVDWKAGAAPVVGEAAHGSTLALVVTGGIGPFSVAPVANAAGGAAVTSWASDRELTLVVPATGAFAGSYGVVVTDDATGATASADVQTPLEITVSTSVLATEDARAVVTITGAAAGSSVLLALVDSSGAEISAGSVATLAGDAVALNSPETGNPAAATLEAVPLTEDRQFRVRATAGDAVGFSASISATASEKGPGGATGGPGCGCSERSGAAPSGAVIAVLALWLRRRRRVAGGVRGDSSSCPRGTVW